MAWGQKVNTGIRAIGLHAEPIALSFAATVNTDASKGSYFYFTATSDFTLANPTNLLDRQRITYEITQDGTGSRIITFGSQFSFGSDITAVVLSTGAGKIDIIGCVWIASASKLMVVAPVKGY